VFDRRYAYLASTIYGAAIAATLIVGSTVAFIVVLIVGGPIVGFMYSRSRCEPGTGRSRERTRLR
jgi:uncharacterized membrane protein